MSVRAVVFTGDGRWQIREFPNPTPPAGGAVLRVDAVGLCHSDVSQLHGHHHVPGEVSPVVPGHEIVGTVHELAPGAELGVEVGDRVAVDLVRFGPPTDDNRSDCTSTDTPAPPTTRVGSGAVTPNS